MVRIHSVISWKKPKLKWTPNLSVLFVGALSPLLDVWWGGKRWKRKSSVFSQCLLGQMLLRGGFLSGGVMWFSYSLAHVFQVSHEGRLISLNRLYLLWEKWVRRPLFCVLRLEKKLGTPSVSGRWKWESVENCPEAWISCVHRRTSKCLCLQFTYILM